ncbi:ribosome silencing factor [Alteromonas lipotrueiana]|uniref:ribosome silencing factor n=1 Tax=Alteromonas lipotrueiana TaxID=2803815 RepID=UPI003CCEBA78|tara:strand:- start:368 stop:718 length:351 start_codon:yes stop_codon:yes gene_type:complete
MSENPTREGVTLQNTELKEFVIDKIDDMKARSITQLNVEGKSSITDLMVICSGNSKRHVVAIADNLVVEAKQAGIKPLSVEGKETGEWVLVDLGEIIVHVMQDETRDFYQLEKLWS